MYIYILLLLFCQISNLFTYKTSPTPWFCTDPNALDSTVELTQKLPTCSPGSVIDIEDVVYESTTDGTCSGSTRCSSSNRNALSFACNRKQSCTIDLRHFRYFINQTCGATVRFFAKYRCLPVIQEKKDYLCETLRRTEPADINLSCEQNYRLHITMALVGISVKPTNGATKTRFKCNQNTYWVCNQYVPDGYRTACSSQLNNGIGDRCRIRVSDRPRLKGCEYGEISNFSLVEYSCIPGESMYEDLPRIDICSDKESERVSINRGLLHSPNYPQPIGKYLSCKKQLFVPRESRLRLFMLEKSIEYYHDLSIRLLNNEPNIQRTLAKNELFDTNITTQLKDETVEIELKTNHVGGGNFLLYFQVDSRISEYAPSVLESERTADDGNRRQKLLVKRDWGVIIGGSIGLVLVLLLIVVVLVIVRFLKHRRTKSLKYMRSDDDQRQHLNKPTFGHDQSNLRQHPVKPIQIEHPHLYPPSSKINSSSVASKENTSDHEALLRRDPYVYATREYFERVNNADTSSLDGRRMNIEHTLSSARPTQESRENEPHLRRSAPLATPEYAKRHLGTTVFDAPMASTETLDVGNSERLKRPSQAPPKAPPPRLDLSHPKPSAPPLQLLHDDRSNITKVPKPT